MAARRRTTHRSSKGTKLYAVRNAKGQITDIQTYQRAHATDLRQTSKAEAAAKAKKKAAPKKKVAAKKKAVSKKAGAKKAAPRKKK